MLVFTVVDPADLRWFGMAEIDWSSSTIYSLAFLAFWLGTSTASAITQVLMTLPTVQRNPIPI